jgi:Fe-S-cluster containining protein
MGELTEDRIICGIVAIAALKKTFRCGQCGCCCREVPIIDLFETDIENLSRALHITYDEARDTYAQIDEETGRYYLKGNPCHFLDQHTNRCSIYDYRPMACVTFPYIQVGIELIESVNNGRLVACPAVRDVVDSSVGLLQAIGSIMQQQGSEGTNRWPEISGVITRYLKDEDLSSRGDR